MATIFSVLQVIRIDRTTTITIMVCEFFIGYIPLKLVFAFRRLADLRIAYISVLRLTASLKLIYDKHLPMFESNLYPI